MPFALCSAFTFVNVVDSYVKFDFVKYCKNNCVLSPKDTSINNNLKVKSEVSLVHRLDSSKF